MSGLRGPLKLWRQQKLKQIFESGRTLRLRFLKEDLGFTYSEKAINTTADSSQNGEFIPEVIVHGRLPHTVVQLIPFGRQVSSLDFISWSKLKSTIFAIENEADSCITVLKSLKNLVHVPVMHVIFLSLDASSPDGNGTSDTGNYIPYVPFEDLEKDECTQLDDGIYVFEGLDVDGTLIHAMRSAGSSAVVVRPDGHILSVHTSTALPEKKPRT